MSINKRIQLIELYCSYEYNDLYYKLKQAKDKAINITFCEKMSGKEEHYHSNLWSCLYDFKKDNKIRETVEELMQLIKDIDFNCDKIHQLHNFKVINRLY